MSLVDLFRSEYRLVYGELFRRKVALIIMIIYPYIFTAFILLAGYTMGSPRVFAERIGVNPVVYMITASFTLFSILGSLDELLWRPLFDMHIGTLPYIMASPVDKLKLYFAIPFPRLTIVLILGFTNLIPVYLVFFGVDGLAAGLLIMGLVILGCILMIPFSIFIAMGIHRVGESWRVLNIIRPVILAFTGIYYPRFYMPLASYVIGSIIPSSHVVEVIQVTLTGLQRGVYALIAIAIALSIAYVPLGKFTLGLWELKKVREGVKIS